MIKQPLDPHTIFEVQSIVRDLMKDKVCSLESQSDETASVMPTYSKQLLHAAREMNQMQLEVFLLLHQVWDEACTALAAEHRGHIETPELPELAPVSPVEVVTD